MASWNIFQKIPKRWVLSIMGFLGFFNGYILRSNLSIAIVAMVYPTVQHSSNGTFKIIPPMYNWNSVTQGFILSAFFYTYIVAQIPSALLARKFGGKVLLGAGIGLCGFVTLFTPLAAQGGAASLIVVRLIEGLLSGVMYPCMQHLWTKWAPRQDKAKLITLPLAGSNFGLAVAMLLGGVIASYWSWEWVFYLSGISALIWTILWFIFVCESPFEHPTITPEEFKYIKENIAPSLSAKSSIPWKAIFLSLPVWAMITAHFATSWPIYTMLLELPTYLSQCLGFDLATSGLLAAIPWFIFSICLYLAGLVSDKFTAQYPTIYVRKFMLSISYILIVIGMLMVILPPIKYRVVIVIGTILTLSFASPAWATFSVNQLDIGGQYTGILMGISNTIASIPGVIIPIIVGYTVPDKNVQTEWNTVFMTTIFICVLVLMFYTLFAAGELQPWAIVNEDESQPVLTNPLTSRNISEQSSPPGSTTDEIRQHVKTQTQHDNNSD